MKISILIAAIIASLAAVFGLQQKEKIKHLTSEWEDLKTIALEKKISIDPQATFSSQRARSDGARAAREKAIADFASELAAFAQKMEAAQESGNGEDAEMQKEIIGFISKLTEMSPTDLKSLVKVLAADNSIEEETKSGLIMMSIMMISSENPEAALAIFSESHKSLDLGEQSEHMLPMILGQYANKDPEAATAWFLENEETLGDKSDEMKKQLVITMAQKDFTTALSMMDKLDMEKDQDIYRRLARGVKSGDQDNFIQALQDHKADSDQREAALTSLANSPFFKEDFQATTAWLDSEKLSSEDRETIVQSLQYYGVSEAPEKWLGWITQPENQSKATEPATRQILRGWTEENFVAAGEWIQDQEAGPTKNTSVKIYAETLAPHEPAAAADWAATLPEGSDRDSVFRSIHSSLKQKDPTAAAALAEKYQLKID